MQNEVQWKTFISEDLVEKKNKMWFMWILFSDQCVDKAKVDESEQKAAEFSKKVRYFFTIPVPSAQSGELLSLIS